MPARNLVTMFGFFSLSNLSHISRQLISFLVPSVSTNHVLSFLSICKRRLPFPPSKGVESQSKLVSGCSFASTFCLLRRLATASALTFSIASLHLSMNTALLYDHLLRLFGSRTVEGVDVLTHRTQEKSPSSFALCSKPFINGRGNN